MRRILKATTAIVTSISLILPQIAVAQGQDGSNVEQLLMQKKKREEQKHQQEKQQPKKEAQPRQQPAREQPKPQPRAANPAPQQREKPRQADEQPARRQQAEPRREPQKPQQQKPAPQQNAQQKPAPRQDAQPKPAPRQDAQPARQQPAPQDKPQAKQADTPRLPPNRRDEQRAPNRDDPRAAGSATGAASVIRDGDQSADKRAPAPGAAKNPRNPPPDAAELKREMQERERPATAPRPDDSAPRAPRTASVRSRRIGRRRGSPSRASRSRVRTAPTCRVPATSPRPNA